MPRPPRITRRQFLKKAVGAAGTAALAKVPLAELQPAAARAPQVLSTDLDGFFIGPDALQFTYMREMGPPNDFLVHNTSNTPIKEFFGWEPKDMEQIQGHAADAIRALRSLKDPESVIRYRYNVATKAWHPEHRVFVADTPTGELYETQYLMPGERTAFGMPIRTDLTHTELGDIGYDSLYDSLWELNQFQSPYGNAGAWSKVSGRLNQDFRRFQGMLDNQRRIDEDLAHKQNMREDDAYRDQYVQQMKDQGRAPGGRFAVPDAMIDQGSPTGFVQPGFDPAANIRQYQKLLQR